MKRFEVKHIRLQIFLDSSMNEVDYKIVVESNKLSDIIERIYQIQEDYMI